MPLHPHQYFSDKSDLYARARPAYPDKLFAFLAGQCRETERVWDCGTGSGQAAVALAAHFHQVDATDVSPEQIAHAAAHPRVTYAVQPAEQTSFPDAVFDLVTVAQALHWFDFGRFWPEVQRTLKPGGVFAAWTYTWLHVSNRVDAVIQHALLEPIRPYWAPQNQLAWDGYRGIPFPFVELAAPKFDLALSWNLEELFAYVSTWSAIRRYLEAKGSALLKNLDEKLRAVWGDPSARKPVVMDFFLRAGRLESPA